MTFLEIRQRVAELMGLSSADTTADDNATMQDKLKAWVNNRYKAICAKRSWNWLIQDSIVQTVLDITTGTVTATADSTTITFTSGPAASVTGYFIQFSDSDDWYEISSHTAASTSATLTTPYLGTTSSTLTYVLRKVYYLLPADTGKILNVSQHRVANTTLQYVSPQILDQYLPLRDSTGQPRFYTIAGINSDRQYKMEIFPTASVRMNLNVRRYEVVDEMTDDDDIPVIPEAFQDIIVWDTLGTYGYMFLDDTRISAAKVHSNEIYQDMIKNDVASENIPVRLPFDVDLNSVSMVDQFNLPIEP